MEEFGPIPSKNALFGRQMYERFLMIGELPASLFQNQLMHAVFSEFKAYWMPVSPARSAYVFFLVFDPTL